MQQQTVKLTEEQQKVLAEILSRQSFKEFVNGLINFAAPYGDPSDSSDIEIARMESRYANQRLRDQDRRPTPTAVE